MAERLTSALQNSMTVSLLLLTLGGCVSTEELYAPYDSVDCKVIIEKSATGKLTLRELISNTHFPWEPAVYFDFDSHELDAANRELLKGAVVVMDRYPALNLSLQGFADRIGSQRYNQALADRRVSTVITLLVAQGVERDRIVDQPLGEGLSQFGNDERLSRSINRRVELMLLDKDGRPLHPLYNFDAL